MGRTSFPSSGLGTHLRETLFRAALRDICFHTETGKQGRFDNPIEWEWTGLAGYHS